MVRTLLIFCFFTSGLILAQDENLSVIKGWLKYSDRENALYRHITDQGLDYLNKRAAGVDRLATKEGWLKRQVLVHKVLMDIVGPFPEKTPLNAQVVAVIKKTGFRMEKIIFESQPKFYVTACLYLPEGIVKKRPAIIYCSGHSNEGFRNLPYQHIILNLVKKGFIVFAFDPVGQGERLQYYEPEFGESRIGFPTLEHSYPGAQCFLIGSSQARHMIWDGIRAVDYLLTREEVDGKRLGITGRSGGGTQSAYIAAFDDRILATAPECYITSFKRLIESIGPQDAEQNFYHGWAKGIDHADLLEVRAPKPALLITTTRDFFSIQGARETTKEIKTAYRAFGKEEYIMQVEDDAEHAPTKKNLEATYAFFQKHLNLPGKNEDEEVAYLTSEELRVTTTGQVSTSLGGETVFSLNLIEAQKSLEKLEHARQNLNLHLSNIKTNAAKMSGYLEPVKNNPAVFTGRYQRNGYSIEKYFLPGEGDYVIPFLLFVPDKKGIHPVVVYLNPKGKSAEANTGQEIEWFVNKGCIVLAPDLPGYGEMGPGIFTGDAYNFKPGKAYYNIWFASIQIARSLTGIHAGDLVRLINYSKSLEKADPSRIFAIAKGELCPVLLHAANFDPTISKIGLVEPLVSYRTILVNQYYQPVFIPPSVAGALEFYDLPDLCASLAPRPLLMVNVLNHIGKPAQKELLSKEYNFVRGYYKSLGAEKKFRIYMQEPYNVMDDIFTEWLSN